MIGAPTLFVYDDETNELILSGQLKARLWARGTGIPAGGSPKANAPASAPDPRLTTTYTYDDETGALTEIHYPAFGQPTGNREPQTGNHTVTYTHDRHGRVKSVTDPTGTRAFDYDARGQLIAEHHTLKTALGGEIRTTLHRAWTDLGQPASVTLSTGPDSIIPAFQHSTAYSWDSLNRLSSVKSLAGTFRYQYDAQNPALLTRMTGPVHRVDTTYEPQRNLIAEVANVAWASLPMGAGRDAAIDRQITNPPPTDPNTAAISRYAYENDPLSRRARIGMTGAAFDRFGAPAAVEVAYNDRSEVTGATYRSTGHPEPRTGNDVSRYTYRYDAIGNREKAAVDTPEAKTETTYAANSLNQYTQVQEKNLRASAAPRETSPAHDPDGNLLADDRFTYTWDAENRLIAATAQDGTHRIEYGYDHQSRRVLRREYHGAAGGALTGETAYLYDDWNLMAEIPLNPNSQTPIPAKLLTWGRDLSGSLQGAGGVGGLLAITEHSRSVPDASGPLSLFPLYDANGNVTHLLDSAGDLVAHYEYDPFGNVTRMEGALAPVNPWRFSTKPEDGATGMLYYGFRYYSPNFGRWASRDPIEENGETNLYGVLSNNAIGKIDIVGLFSDEQYCSCIKITWFNTNTRLAGGTSFEPVVDGYLPSSRGNNVSLASWVAVTWKRDGICNNCRIENQDRLVSNLEVRVFRISGDKDVPLYQRSFNNWAPIAGPDYGYRLGGGEYMTNQAPVRWALPTQNPGWKLRVQIVSGREVVCEERIFSITSDRKKAPIPKLPPFRIF